MCRLLLITVHALYISSCVAQSGVTTVPTNYVGSLIPVKCIADTLFVFNCTIDGDSSMIVAPCADGICELDVIQSKDSICLEMLFKFPLDEGHSVRLLGRSVIIDSVLFQKDRPVYRICD